MAKKRTGETVFAVIGLGVFGSRLCEELADRGGTVIGIDSVPERVERLKNVLTQGIVMDATDAEGFVRTSLSDVDIAVVGIGDNIEANILATAVLRQQGVPHIVSRAVNPIHKQVLSQIGANEIIDLEEDAGIRLAARLLTSQTQDRLRLSEDISISEVPCPPGFDSKNLRELDLRNRLNVTLVAVKRLTVGVREDGAPQRTEELLFPDADFTLREEDTLILVGYDDSIDQIRDLRA